MRGGSAAAALKALEGDGTVGRSFRTPLATLHKFNGWADQFLTTPGAGLQDSYLRLGYRMQSWTFAFRFHDFRADAGNEKWGSEFNFSATHKLSDGMSLMLKAAHFDAKSTNFADTTKLWLMLTAGF